MVLLFDLFFPELRDEREREYYNDMPGKVPPDVGPPPVPPLPNLNLNISAEPRGNFSPFNSYKFFNCGFITEA